ncbi:MAG TPA: hypothetical protein VFT91_06560 [Dehalococcoidia bacterium]|nr:hypothetical protein [Dehalococcoidia bacterium]
MKRQNATIELDESSRDPLLDVVQEELTSEIKMRAQRLLVDLAEDDIGLAFLDLAQLHRAVRAHAGARGGRVGPQGNQDDGEEDWQRFFS